jgi:hypothetical protein
MTIRQSLSFPVAFALCVWALHADEKIQEPPPPAPIHLTLSKESPQKGLLLEVPESIPVASVGKEHVIRCVVTNTLEEPVFVQTEALEGYTLAYNDQQISIGVGSMWHGHSASYALLQGSRYYEGKRASDCCSQCFKKVKIDLSSDLKPGDRVRVTLPVSGYFLKTGQPFQSRIEIVLRIAEPSP